MKIIILTILFTLVLSQTDETGCETYFDSTKKQCVKCKENYILVVKPKQETELVPQIQCEKASDNQNCDKESNGLCYKCKEGYYLDGTLCLPCPENCAKCTFNGKCIKCKEGLFLSIDQSICTNCKGENATYCGKCKDGQYFDVSGIGCTDCKKYCDLCTDSTNCFKCKPTYYLDPNGICKKLEHCHIKGENENYCIRCDDDYRLDGGGCKKCVDNCKQCFLNKTNGEECLKCAEKYVLLNNECIQIDKTNCMKANDGYGCAKCKDNYFLNSKLDCEQCDPKCKTCVKQADNCLTTSSDYYFDKNGTVKKVDSNCEISDQSGCKKCRNDLNDIGFFVKDGVCEKCGTNCTLCQNTAENCTSCINENTLYWD